MSVTCHLMRSADRTYDGIPFGRNRSGALADNRQQVSAMMPLLSSGLLTPSYPPPPHTHTPFSSLLAGSGGRGLFSDVWYSLRVLLCVCVCVLQPQQLFELQG